MGSFKVTKRQKNSGSKWVFKTKKNVHEGIERCQAQLVAQGCSQKYIQDDDKTFSAVVRFASITMVIALAVKFGLKLHQIDVTTAFLKVI